MSRRVLIPALLHLLPLPGLLGNGSLQSLYALPPLDAATELLLRHRALMFALDAALLLWAIRAPALRLPAIMLTLASDTGFLLLGQGSLPPGLLRVALFDGVSILLLVTSAACLRQTAKAHP